MVNQLRILFKKGHAIGILLLMAAIVALVWANSPWKEYYFALLDIEFDIELGSKSLSENLKHWINDGLMAIFFFHAGLEIKREIIQGELSTIRKAALPVAAAFGGMAAPALLFSLVNSGLPTLDGWGIPIATDIAFSLGLLAMVGSRVPVALKIFLVALAIVDDIGAVMVIALFYSSELNTMNLVLAGGAMAILLLGNYIGIRKTAFYAIVGALGLWLAILFSGIHSTVAGILLAFTIPARTAVSEENFALKLGELMPKFMRHRHEHPRMITTQQATVLEKIQRAVDKAHTPLHRLEHSLHPMVYYFIVPIFAFANSGIDLEGETLKSALSPLSVGIMLGLVVGKPLGVFGMVFLLRLFRIAPLPEGISMGHILGAGMLAGVGFTMSLFISELAFRDAELLIQAKLGILLASLISGAAGLSYLYIIGGRKRKVV